MLEGASPPRVVAEGRMEGVVVGRMEGVTEGRMEGVVVGRVGRMDSEGGAVLGLLSPPTRAKCRLDVCAYRIAWV